MQRNKILQATLSLNRILYWLGIILLTVFIGFMFHSIISPDAYKSLLITENERLRLIFDFCKECPRNEDNVFLSDVGTPMKVWMLVRYSVIMFLIILMLRRGVLIWKSVKERSTFCAKNSSYFRQIAIYAFILFLMVSFNFVDEGKHGIGLQIGIAMEWLAVSLTNLGMSEVFKEGLKLQKDVDAVI